MTPVSVRSYCITRCGSSLVPTFTTAYTAMSAIAGIAPKVEPMERNTDREERSLSLEVTTCASEP